MNPELLASYKEFSSKVEEKFQQIQGKYPSAFACQKGCHSCCKPDLTVGPLEAANIQEFFATHSDLAEQAKALAKANPHRGKRCVFLTQAGACLIYEARPLVCRSHGAPMQFRDPDSKDDSRLRDVCPLNFTTQSIADLPAEDVLNLDTVNTLLALLTKRAFKKYTRTPLRELIP